MLRIACCVALSFTFALVISVSSFEDVGKDPRPCGQPPLTKPNDNFHLVNVTLTEGHCIWSITPVNRTGNICLFMEYLFLEQNDVVTFHSNHTDAESGVNPLFELRAEDYAVPILTELKEIYIRLTGNNTVFKRKFEGMYYSKDCSMNVSPSITSIRSPILVNVSAEHLDDCVLVYNSNSNFAYTMAFVFDGFNFTSSKVLLEGTTRDGEYSKDPAIDFFPTKSVLRFELKLDTKTLPTEYFKLKMEKVNKYCSGYKELKEGTGDTEILKSPLNALDNGTINHECRWVIKNTDSSKTIGVTFDKLDFDSVFDIVAINDGGSILSEPLLQVTKSNANLTARQPIRTSGQYVWVALKFTSFATNFSANATMHGQGGYFKGKGAISVKPTTGDDTVFLLEVDSNEVVVLNFTATSIKPPAALSIYDGFDVANLLTTIHNDPWYPVMSRSSKMMIIATKFNTASLSATFQGMPPGQMHMSTLTSDSYVLSGNCNATSIWIVPPQDVVNDELLLDLQYISLEDKDELKIMRLDSEKTMLGTVSAGVTHVPQFSLKASEGALVEVTRGECAKPDDVVLVGHSSYVPACGGSLTPKPSEMFSVTSPGYPDTYPLLSSCEWNVVTSNKNIVHLSFSKLKLAPNHCVSIVCSDKKKTTYEGSNLPDDFFAVSNVSVQFDSSNCGKGKVTEELVSAEGYLLNGTVSDCGQILEGAKSGEFNTSITSNQTVCIWKIQVPPSNGDGSVNIISYTVSMKDDKKNYELHVYDGASVRDGEIKNTSSSEILSRTNSLIISYKKLDVAKPSSVLVLKYETKSCNKSSLCENKICMHPDWRCNGLNECGDYSDEKNCDFVPVPPETKHSGYSGGTLAGLSISMLIFGILLGIVVPVLVQKYRDGQYHRFSDISVIE